MQFQASPDNSVKEIDCFYELLYSSKQISLRLLTNGMINSKKCQLCDVLSQTFSDHFNQESK